MDPIIDFHTHLFPERVAPRAIPQMYEYCKIPYRTIGDIPQLAAAARREGVALCVNHPVCTNPAKVRSCNEFASRIAATPGFASFGCLHPDMSGWREELKHFKQWGLIGLKIHNDYQGFYFNSKLCLDMIEAAYDEGLMVLVHAGMDPVSPDCTRCTPKMISDAMPLLRQGTFIAAHLGGHLMLDDAMKYVIGSEVYIDTSMAAMYYSDVRCREAILAHDPDRVLFGSDSPWDDAATAVRVLRRMDLGQERLEKILYRNATRLLNPESVTERYLA
jgi:hypothetical protein